jgi:release factor glutamine methyltransferase
MYLPSEDSLLFSNFLEGHLLKEHRRDMQILDMGSGTGILAEVCSKFIQKKNILCVDIQDDCLVSLRKKGFNTIQSDLFEKIPAANRFDLIIFNAPYLPEDKNEERHSQLETTGGKRGDEVSLKFLREAKNFLKKGGKILLLVSSITPFDKIKKFKPEIVARKKIWFEELLLLQFTNE